MTTRTLWLGCTLTALIAHAAVAQDAGILIGVADRVDCCMGGTRLPAAGQRVVPAQGPVAWPLPASAVGYAEPPLDWQAVTGAVPGAQEAFASPRRDLVLITLATAFRVYTLTGGKPGTVLLELPRPKTATQDQVVMVQWALGVFPRADGCQVVIETWDTNVARTLSRLFQTVRLGS
jgi:hypothetical protein